MGAPLNNKNAFGNSGGGMTALNDKKLMAKVRNLALKKIEKILESAAVEMSERERRLHDQLLLNLARHILPRVKEVDSDDDGGPPIIHIVNYAELIS